MENHRLMNFPRIIGAFLLFLPVATNAQELLPDSYIKLILHEDYRASIALSDDDIKYAKIQGTRHHAKLCLVLERRVWIDYFDSAQPLADQQATIEDALACRAGLKQTAVNTTHTLWLNARLANLAVRQGDGKRASTLLAMVAQQIEGKHAPIDPLIYATAASALSNAAVARSDLMGAYEWVHKGLAVLGGRDALSRMVRARSLIWGSYLLGRQGRFDEAEAAGNEAITLVGDTFGTPSVSRSEAFFSLGQVQYFANRFGAARSTIENAIADDRKIGAPALHNLSASLSLLGNLLRQVGEYESARAALTEAIAFGRADPSDRINLYARLDNLGALELESGHCDAAIAPLHEALDFGRQHFGTESIRLAPTLESLGLCEFYTQHLVDGRADISQALTIASKSNGEQSPLLADYILQMARIELAEHDYVAATQHLQHALSLLPEDPDVLIATRIQIERNLARVLHAQHQDDAAFEHAVASESARLRLLHSFANVLEETAGLGLRDKQVGGMDQLLALAAESRPARINKRGW